MLPRPLALVALLLAPALAVPAADAPPGKSRVHNAEFVMPDGWLRGNNEYGNLVLVPPDQPNGQRLEIHIAPFDQTPRGVRGHAQTSADNLKKEFDDVRIEQPVSPGRLPSGATTATVVASAAFRDAPGQRILVHFTEIDGGGESSQGVALVATHPETFRKYRRAYDELVNSITLPSHTRLVEARGDLPALTLYESHTVIDFLEWSLAVPFTQSQRDAVQEHLVAAWKKADKAEIDGVAEITKARLELDKLTDANKKEYARQAIRTAILKQWRQEAGQGDAMAKLMVDIYDAAHQPLAPVAAGRPSLTRQCTDATMEVLHFMAGRVAGVATDVAPSAEQKDQFARNLAAAYPTMSAENREELSKMPTYWAALRCAWPELPADERTKLTAAWATSEQVKPIVEQVKTAQAKAAQAAAASSASSSSSGDPLAAAKAMQKLYQQQQTYQMLSNMSHQMHMSRMQIINNIGSSNYRYEYRYTYRYR